MKGLIGLIFLGICIVVAAAIIVGAVTFPEAVGFLWSIIFWIIMVIVIIIVAIIMGIIILAVIES